MGRTVQFELAEMRGELPVQIFGGETVTIRISDADERVQELKKCLKAIEFRVLFLRFCCGCSEAETARKIGKGLNRNKVHGIATSAVKKAQKSKAQVVKP